MIRLSGGTKVASRIGSSELWVSPDTNDIVVCRSGRGWGKTNPIDQDDGISQNALVVDRKGRYVSMQLHMVKEGRLHGQHVCDPVDPYLNDLPLEYAVSWACRMHGAKCRLIDGTVFILPDDNERRWHESRRVWGKVDVWPGLEKAYRRFIEMAVHVGLKEEVSGACDRYIELFPDRRDDACVQKWRTTSPHR